MPPPMTKPATAAPMTRLLLVLDELAAPVRQDGDLLLQALHRRAELAAVGLDRGADLLRRAGRHLALLLAPEHQRPLDLAGLVDRHLRASAASSP